MEKNVLDVEYKIYDQRTRALYTVRESADCPGITDLLQIEDKKEVGRISLSDDDLPLLIEALQRRLADSQRLQ